MDRHRIWSTLKRARDERTRDRRGKPIRQRMPLSAASFAVDAGLPDDPSSLRCLAGVRQEAELGL